MKILFLIFHGFEAYNGISKKIHYQIDALRQCGADTHLCHIHIDEAGNQQRMIDNEVLESFEHGIGGKIKKWTDYSAILRYIRENKTDLLYIRSYHNANPLLNSMVKKLKKDGVKTVMEIPTYPYDQEYKGHPFTSHLKLLLDKCFRHSLAKQLFRIITFSNSKDIFGASTINISNGIDFDAVKVKEGLTNAPNCLHLISVAEIHPWHGFDRLIAGLAEYYRTTKQFIVLYDIVGYGDEVQIEKLKKMVGDNNLQDYVTFHGSLFGENLDRLFDNADMGIASLARHRSGITNIKTLKNREYAARGIPFVYSEIDDDFENMPYIMKVPADETPIDIQQIIDFYKSVRLSPVKIRESIKFLSWKNQMQVVIDECSKSNN